jgi:hypothetical protein
VQPVDPSASAPPPPSTPSARPSPHGAPPNSVQRLLTPRWSDWGPLRLSLVSARVKSRVPHQLSPSPSLHRFGGLWQACRTHPDPCPTPWRGLGGVPGDISEERAFAQPPKPNTPLCHCGQASGPPQRLRALPTVFARPWGPAGASPARAVAAAVGLRRARERLPCDLGLRPCPGGRCPRTPPPGPYSGERTPAPRFWVEETSTQGEMWFHGVGAATPVSTDFGPGARWRRLRTLCVPLQGFCMREGASGSSVPPTGSESGKSSGSALSVRALTIQSFLGDFGLSRRPFAELFYM